jgi:hypothetical protein
MIESDEDLWNGKPGFYTLEYQIIRPSKHSKTIQKTIDEYLRQPNGKQVRVSEEPKYIFISHPSVKDPETELVDLYVW